MHIVRVDDDKIGLDLAVVAREVSPNSGSILPLFFLPGIKDGQFFPYVSANKKDAFTNAQAQKTIGNKHFLRFVGPFLGTIALIS